MIGFGRDDSPQAPDTVFAQLRPSPQKQFVLVKGQYSPDPEKSERTIIFSMLGPYLWKVADVWLSPSGHAELHSRLGGTSTIFSGSCDAMYATSARHVWAVVNQELHLWRRRILIARFSAREVVRRRGLVAWSTHPIQSFTCCHGYASLTWAKRGVALERTLGRRVVIAETTELAALIDPTYDGIDLMCDAGWIGDLVRAITAVTSLPEKLDEGLL